MGDRVYNVLFLCRYNSARSIFAECALQRWANRRFNGFSAGSQPAEQIHPLTTRILTAFNYRTDHLRSKSWDEFQTADAPPMDFVFTVCAQTAEAGCPVFPGRPMTAHWPIEDPVDVPCDDPEKRSKAFRRAYLEIETRVKYFTALRLEGLDKLALQSRLTDIGRPAATVAAAP